MRVVRSASIPAASSRARSPPTCRCVQPTKFELVINAQDRQDARPHRAADAARPRRRGDRMRAARVHHAARRRGGGVAAGGAGAAAGPMRRVGVITGAGVDADDADMKARFAAFLRRRWSNWAGATAATCRSTIALGSGNPDDIRRHAVELAALAPDVILSSGAATVGPIVAGDPHHTGRVRRASSIRSAPALSIAWRSRAATPPALSCWNTA